MSFSRQINSTKKPDKTQRKVEFEMKKNKKSLNSVTPRWEPLTKNQINLLIKVLIHLIGATNLMQDPKFQKFVAGEYNSFPLGIYEIKRVIDLPDAFSITRIKDSDILDSPNEILAIGAARILIIGNPEIHFVIPRCI
ncbi:MAG TPA: hypothetical protein PKE08_01815 [Candidatus Paceibacterota bacterium]|nr:hypothetical protein [Candidatus Paceibacterota bacterium]